MTVYRVTYTNVPPIRELEIFGEITYDSPIMKILWIRTNVNIETLQRLENISLVEVDIKPERTGTNCV